MQALTVAMSKPVFQYVQDAMKQLFIQIVVVLKDKRNLLKLAVVNFHGLVNGVLKADSFLGLEMEVQTALKMREAYLKSQGQVITLD
jgi:hypothetical protein